MTLQKVHQTYMSRALELALKGKGQVEPNPLVGAVLVKGQSVIGEGFHEYFGGPHAEINAINTAISSTKGTTLYVTLEPCTHYGKTPPCVNAIIRAGIKEVVLAIRDPNPINNGRGVTLLKKAGLRVKEGILKEKARAINLPYFKLHLKGLPYVIAKWAMSLDGKIATRTGESKWISSAVSRNWFRQYRTKVDAIMVGIETVLKDDPLLLAYSHGRKNPKRIILDRRARIPLHSRIVRTSSRSETCLAISHSVPWRRVKRLIDAGCYIYRINEKGNKLDIIQLAKIITTLGVNKVLIEGGGEVLASAFESGLVDEVLIFIAPKIIGGRTAKTPVEGKGIAYLKDALKIGEITFQQMGPDSVIHGKIRSKGN